MAATIDTPEHTGGLWLRHAGELMEVSFPERTIELVVMPYETETLVPHPTDPGRNRMMVRESIARGAFDGIERRANRVKANRDHDTKRTFGKAVSLRPSAREGLVGKVHVARTPLGDETLELADDGCLEASAGFLPMPGGMKWSGRTGYQVTKAWLGHIALVPDGAYGEDAPVLAVRQANPEPGPGVERQVLPHVEAYRLQRAREQYAALDARWIRPAE